MKVKTLNSKIVVPALCAIALLIGISLFPKHEVLAQEIEITPQPEVLLEKQQGQVIGSEVSASGTVSLEAVYTWGGFFSNEKTVFNSGDSIMYGMEINIFPKATS